MPPLHLPALAFPGIPPSRFGPARASCVPGEFWLVYNVSKTDRLVRRRSPPRRLAGHLGRFVVNSWSLLQPTSLSIAIQAVPDIGMYKLLIFSMGSASIQNETCDNGRKAWWTALEKLQDGDVRTNNLLGSPTAGPRCRFSPAVRKTVSRQWKSS